ncbi:MAG TPA: MBL fold metallo-hydrolase [Allosphingosinicella sp.]|jgi:glyoxylase-like metal-dependent hydrolase (beta-lactamase superfamily II)
MTMLRFLAVLSAACLMLPPLSACAQAAPGHLMAPEKVTDRIHVMRQPDRIWSAVIGNVTIVEQSDGVVLIDSGGTLADGRQVAAAVRALTSKPVKAVAITHWHNDHPLGVRGIIERWPRARIIATEAARRRMIEVMGRNVAIGRNDPRLDTARLNTGQARIAEYEANARDPKLSEEERREFAADARYMKERLREQMGSYVVLPTQTFRDRLTIGDREAPVELLVLGRANTDGDLVAWMPAQKVVATGDAVVAPTPYGFNSYPADWIAVLGRIRALPFVRLIPGHGAVQSDRRHLDVLIASLSDVRGQVAALAAQGVAQEEVRSKVDYSGQVRLFGADGDWAKRWLEAYWLGPITSSAWREAKGIPIEPGG